MAHHRLHGSASARPKVRPTKCSPWTGSGTWTVLRLHRGMRRPTARPTKSDWAYKSEAHRLHGSASARPSPRSSSLFAWGSKLRWQRRWQRLSSASAPSGAPDQAGASAHVGKRNHRRPPSLLRRSAAPFLAVLLGGARPPCAIPRGLCSPPFAAASSQASSRLPAVVFLFM